ncbi:oxygen-independent coproporphyrinogen III oxidase [Alsobacter metallidurans]|uniref:Coproporphyrinogen-III oxidase n=1 Tax=Alsobacter metallidurans TaxID=340221 RepID=A0A917MLL3_9HYPH|nr:oxygen-independent coproporphyrinogen III oxidase [Alsobacter metallidurans]GGH30701.1 oxygen-independent coproporphyrinogen III oxidase [Alsobacter metallidurans]
MPIPSSLILAEKSVPRYTSYPTAPHFTAAVDGAVARHWMGELPAGASLSVYLHVPYCRAMCNYCGCNTKVARRQEPLDDYTETLLAEIDVLADATAARRVTHIHWGGGTPSLLGPERLARLADKLASRFNLGGIVEHAIELDPRTVDPALAAGLARIGINRASLGVQDLNLHVQTAIGRVQPYETVARCVAMLRAVGVEAINLDLMYGLPHQSVDDVVRTAELSAGLDPTRLAIFGYAHVPWFKVHQRLIDAAALPGAAERLQQAAAARDALVGRGYDVIGLDHFARPDDPMAIAARDGTLRRNFQGYTTDVADALVGLGASSIGRLPKGYIQNAPDVAGWRRAVEAGELPVVKGVPFSVEDHVRAGVIERLMCDFAVDFGALAQAAYGHAEALDDAIAPLQDLQRDGVLRLDGRRVALTEAGKPFMRLAAAAFDSYLHAGSARHSAAV